MYKFQLTIMNECKVIHKQPPIRTQIRSFLTIFKCISRLIQFIFMMDQITYVIHQLHYYIYLVYKFQLAIMNECKVIHKQPPIRTQIKSFLTIFDSISRLTSIYFHDGNQITYVIHQLHYNIYLVYKF